MWGFPCSLRKLSGMVVRMVEHYQCGAFHVRYVNSQEWLYVCEQVQPVWGCPCSLRKLSRMVGRMNREWLDVQVTTAIVG